MVNVNYEVRCMYSKKQRSTIYFEILFYSPMDCSMNTKHQFTIISIKIYFINCDCESETSLRVKKKTTDNSDLIRKKLILLFAVLKILLDCFCQVQSSRELEKPH